MQRKICGALNEANYDQNNLKFQNLPRYRIFKDFPEISILMCRNGIPETGKTNSCDFSCYSGGTKGRLKMKKNYLDLFLSK